MLRTGAVAVINPLCCLACHGRWADAAPYCRRCGQRLVPPEIPANLEERALADSSGFVRKAPGVLQDRRTGLYWQQTGSPQPLSYVQAPPYLEALNRLTWGGRQDWRLPSLGELSGLLTPEKNLRGLYIDPVFDGRRRICWSGSLSPTGGAYGVLFYPGSVLAQPLTQGAYVRAVAGRGEGPAESAVLGAGRAPRTGESTPALLRQGQELLFTGERRRIPRRQEMEDFLQAGGFISEVILTAGRELYFLPSEEFLQALIRLFRRLGVSRVVEVGAGDGLAAAALQERGFPVTATDRVGQTAAPPYGLPVYPADHLEAVRQFRPELVFWCWPPLGSQAPREILTAPGLTYYLEIGDGGFAAGDSTLVAQGRGRYLPTLSQLGYTRLDWGTYRHNRCFLFKASGGS